MEIDSNSNVSTPFSIIQGIVNEFNTHSYSSEQARKDSARECMESKIFHVLNKCWNKAHNSNDVVEIQNLLNDSVYREGPIIHKFDKFKASTSNLSVVFKGKRNIIYKLFNFWFEDYRRTEVAITYTPSKNEDDVKLHSNLSQADRDRVKVLNTFSESIFAMPYENCKNAPTLEGQSLEDDLLYKHIKTVICRGDDVQTKYLCSWFSFILTKRIKSCICPVITGIHGSGKSTVGQIIGTKIFGIDLMCPIQNIDDLTKGEKIKRALLVLADDISPMSKHQYDRFKSYITESLQQMRKPHGESKEHFDFANVLMTINNDLAVDRMFPMDVHERRFVYFRAEKMNFNNSKEAERLYFEKLYSHDVRSFARYLYEMDHQFYPGKILMTDEYGKAVLGAMDDISSWWYECLKRGTVDEKESLIVFDWNNPPKDNRVSRSDVYKWFTTTGRKRDASRFWPHLKNLGAYVDSGKTRNERYVCIKSLSECRASFRHSFRNKVPVFEDNLPLSPHDQSLKDDNEMEDEENVILEPAHENPISDDDEEDEDTASILCKSEIENGMTSNDVDSEHCVNYIDENGNYSHAYIRAMDLASFHYGNTWIQKIRNARVNHMMSVFNELNQYDLSVLSSYNNQCSDKNYRTKVSQLLYNALIIWLKFTPYQAYKVQGELIEQIPMSQLSSLSNFDTFLDLIQVACNSVFSLNSFDKVYVEEYE